MHPCNKSSCTEVILVCPWCGVVTEAGALASPQCTERNFMWQRVEWNVRSLSGKHRWLCSFRCFGKGDGESAHSCESVERRLRLLESGMQMRCDLCQARGKSALRWTIKSGKSELEMPRFWIQSSTVRRNMHSWCVVLLLSDRQWDNQVWLWDCCTWTLQRDRCRN